MPWGLTRFQQSGQSHFVTFCCYHRHRLLQQTLAAESSSQPWSAYRRSFKLHVYGYVVMPEHVHLLLSEPQRDTLADALKSLKQGVSRRLIPKMGGPLKPAFGLCAEKPYYDFNIRNYPQFVEKLRYIQRNPVKQGLCESPAD